MKFSIESVSKMTGIPSTSLRNWEKRHGFPQPVRTTGGHRFYSDRDVEFLKEAAHLIEEGHSFGDLADRYEKEVLKPVTSSYSAPRKTETLTDDVSYRVELIYKALLNFDQQATLQHYAILNSKLSPENLFDRVFEVILKRLGVDRKKGQITAAQEHFTSSFVRMKLSAFLGIEFPAHQNVKILTASAMDVHHEGCLMLMSAHLKFRGYAVFHFGLDLPLADLKDLAHGVQPHVICLSYEDAHVLKSNFDVICELGFPVCISGGALTNYEVLESLKSEKSRGLVYFCHKSLGSEAARFVEMIYQSKS